jgi:hypothetical protein
MGFPLRKLSISDLKDFVKVIKPGNPLDSYTFSIDEIRTVKSRSASPLGLTAQRSHPIVLSIRGNKNILFFAKTRGGDFLSLKDRHLA